MTKSWKSWTTNNVPLLQSRRSTFVKVEYLTCSMYSNYSPTFNLPCSVNPTLFRWKLIYSPSSWQLWDTEESVRTLFIRIRSPIGVCQHRQTEEVENFRLKLLPQHGKTSRRNLRVVVIVKAYNNQYRDSKFARWIRRLQKFKNCHHSWK